MALNEYGVKLDSNGYAPSILNQQPACLICGRYHTARHEVFYGPTGIRASTWDCGRISARGVTRTARTPSTATMTKISA